MKLPSIVLWLGIATYSLGQESESWMGWRGPTQDGHAATNAKPPIEWSKDQHVRWTVDLPGEGSSTPIVYKNQIFVLSAQKTDRKSEQVIAAKEGARTAPDNFYYRFMVSSIDRTTGKVLWEKIATEQVPHEGHHETHTYAGGSPCTDGERLYISFASRGIFCYTLDCKELWQVDLGDMRTRLGWGEAVTPVIAGEYLLVNWDQEENSFLVALDRKTGKEVWRTARPSEPTSWNTPLVVSEANKPIAVINGSGKVRAYDVATGKEIWTCGGQTVNAIPSPVRYEDTVICISGYRGAAGVAIPIASQGDVTDASTLRWKISQGTPYVPSPALSENRLWFTAGNNGLLSCVDAKTGKVLVDRKRIQGAGTLYASPLVANGYVYLCSREGVTVVLKDDASAEIVATNALEGPMDASPVAVGSDLLLRSWKKLYCLSGSNSSK